MSRRYASRRYAGGLGLGLCSLGARRKSRFLVLGAEKRRFFEAPKKNKAADWLPAQADLIFWGVEKVIWPPNTITRRRRKKKAADWSPTQADLNFWGVEKVIWPPNTITRRRQKPPKKTRFSRLAAEKYGFRAPKEQRPISVRLAPV